MSNQQRENTETHLNDPSALRRLTLAKIRQRGDAYPNNFSPTYEVWQVIQNASDFEKEKTIVRLGGRVMGQRKMGKVHFLDLQDGSDRIQVYLRLQDVETQTVGKLEELDTTDHIGIEGIVFYTKSGELSIQCQKFWLLAKSLHPLSKEHYGLKDPETLNRYRERALIMNRDSRKVFELRFRLLKAIRAFFYEKNYLEVETPMLQSIAGGALARPFITHHNVLDMDLQLRIAPELFLKRLGVGGFKRVFELNRNFRNEGISARHNPEFTMLEYYEAYADCQAMMGLTEALIRQLAQTVLGSQTLYYQGEQYDLGIPFQRLTVVEALLRYCPTLTLAILQDFDQLKTWANDYITHNLTSRGALQFALFEELVEKKLQFPTFITEHPIEVSPLARCKTDNPEVADRFELYIAGRELANGFSELNDPEDQAERFKAQLIEKEKGNLEAMSYDQDYITALEYGLPPTGGAGMGIDRLTMLFANVASIRDVILFPLLRPVE
jgi:lysyl-tRNA synthetase class 2